MLNSATSRDRWLRRTKAQLVDEIISLEAEKTSDGPDAADHGQSDLARQLAENPYPVLRVMPDGTVLYANAAAMAVDGLIKGRDKSVLASGLAAICAQVCAGDEVRETECTFGDRVFAFSIAPVANEAYVNIYGHDMSRRQVAYRALAAKDAQLRAALDHMKGGIKLVDRDLNCVLVNPQYSEMCGYPEKLVEVGSAMLDELRFQVERGDFGPVSLAEIQEQVFAIYRSGQESRRERTFPNGRTVEIHVAPMPDGGYVDVLSDVTERKQAEEALKVSEERYALAMTASNEGLWDWDLRSDEIFISPQVAELLGVEEGVEKISPGRWDAAVHPDDFENFNEATQAHHRGETAFYACEYRVLGRDGVFRWVYDRGLGLQDEDGTTYRMAGSLGDITERRQFDEALRDSRERLYAVIDAVPAMISAKDRDARYLFVNRYQAELYGVSRSDAVGKTAGDLLGEAYGEHTKRLDRQVIESGEALPYFEEDHTDAHGVSRQLLATKVPLKDRNGHIQGVVTVALDISERKRVERAFQESEARFVQAAHLANLGHWTWDEVKDICTYCSDELARIHGMTVERYMSATANLAGDLALIHPEDRDAYFRITRKWEGGATTYESEYRIVRPDGEVRHVRETAEGIRDETGRMIRSFGTVQDITERKRAEQELLEATQRAEAANNLVLDKNRMLESLSSKLSRYLSPQVYASIFSGDQSVEIASKRKKLTVFFSDIADFTGTTDSLESEELTNLLNHYLTEMSKIALDHGATIDKYVGDSIIAFFGDPQTRGAKEDAKACVTMAIAMQRRMQELQSEWLDMGLEGPFQQRIGINTGFCTVGNFGSEDRMDYTIIGNEVNLAARLESHAKVGGILMTHETYSLVRDTIAAEESGTLTVKGFANAVRTYNVIGIYDDLEREGRVFRSQRDGVQVQVDLTKSDKATAIQALEDVLSKLKE